jgi:hypothetical protein
LRLAREQVACTTANGFETGKSYNIYVSAIVDSDIGGIGFGFTVSIFYDVISIGPELRAVDEFLPRIRSAQEL